MDKRKLDAEMQELFAVAGFRGSVPHSGNTQVTTAEARELYGEVKRFFLSKEYAQFEAKHIPRQSYMPELERAYERFKGIVKPPTKHAQSANPVPQIIQDCGKFVDVHKTAREFAGLQRSDAISRALYLYSMNGQAFPTLTFNEAEEPDMTGAKLKKYIETANSHLIAQAKGYTKLFPERFKGLTEEQAITAALRLSFNGQADFTGIEVEEISPGKWQPKKKGT